MKHNCRNATVLLTLAVLPAGCLSSLPTSEEALRIEGTLAVDGAALGKVEIKPSVCLAGDRQQFLGADFQDPSSGLTVRLVVDPLGDAAVRVFSAAAPFERSVVFRRGECGVFHFSLDSTGWSINDVDDYAVTLQLDCSTPAGSIRGSAAAAHCH